MTESLLGLSKIPFTKLPHGEEVFIGPQTAGLVEAFRSGLNSPDAIAVVTGPAGSGKTTLVRYALDALYPEKKIIRVGRSPLRPQAVLESLLIVLGVKNRPVERKRRLAILQDALRQYAKAGVTVVVAVENAVASGKEMLAELAAFATVGADESGGARLVLMGPESLPEFLQRPELAELQARVSLQYGIKALSIAETQGYLLHCFRNAGGDFNQLFEPDCSALLQKICNGNPRAINQLAEVVLRTADELNLEEISAHYIADVAAKIYDPQIHDFRFVAQPAEGNATDNEESVEAPNAKDRAKTLEEDIASAERLEDLDDLSAETIFGQEITELAALATGTEK